MVPTLLGRIQTRILLTIILGIPLTALFVVTIMWFFWPNLFDTSWDIPFYILGILLIVGLILDPVYIQLQRFRWDQDWPFGFQFFFSIVEFCIVLALIKWGVFETATNPYTPVEIPSSLPVAVAVTHFTIVFIPTFLSLLGGVQLFLVRWRYKGAELGRM